MSCSDSINSIIYNLWDHFGYFSSSLHLLQLIRDFGEVILPKHPVAVASPLNPFVFVYLNKSKLRILLATVTIARRPGCACWAVIHILCSLAFHIMCQPHMILKTRLPFVSNG